ncbi:hypothetical protein FRC09_020747 [Ceratobasidium sp. 395]|nr:hypothetical protein FRC09_020747 [Ceratobasidium sp. 395]
MPKIVSRSAISSSIDDKSLSLLTRRKTDGAIIVRSQDAPTAKARVFKLNVNIASQPVMLERKTENGFAHERQYRFNCTRCDLMIGYQSTPAPLKSGPFVYILWGAVSQIQGQCPTEAFEGEEAALAMAAARNAKINNA